MCRTARPGWPVREMPLPPRVIARSLTPSQERFNDFDVVQTGAQVLSTQAIATPEAFRQEIRFRSLTVLRNSRIVGAFARFPSADVHEGGDMEKRFTEKVSDRLPLLSLAMFLTACGGAPTPAPAPTPVPIPSNPVPAITSISPTGATAGGATFTLTVSGTGFISTSVVRWNGNDRPTAFQDSTHMTAQIPASDIATVAAASVAVFNPVPGGGTSSAIPFAIIATVGGFNPAGSMSVPRRNHTATLLPNGEVLVAGGVSLVCCDPVPVSEIFDPKTNQFRNTGSMSAPRYAHTATLLPDGRVLLAGGLAPPDPNLAVQALSSAELYDPATGTFTPTGSMVDARSAHTGTLLPNGKVLVTGGRQNESFNVLQRAEIYDPATGGFTLTGNMTERRASHTAVLLKDGSSRAAAWHGSEAVLVGGGFGDRCDPDG